MSKEDRVAINGVGIAESVIGGTKAAAKTNAQRAAEAAASAKKYGWTPTSTGFNLVQARVAPTGNISSYTFDEGKTSKADGTQPKIVYTGKKTTQPAATTPATPKAPTTPTTSAADKYKAFVNAPDNYGGNRSGGGGGGGSSSGSAATPDKLVGMFDRTGGLPTGTTGAAAAAPATPSQQAQALARMNALTRPELTDTYAGRIAEMEANPYAAYDPKYIPQMDELMGRLQNRQFRYAQSEDPLYRQYAARYQQQARQGMQDTMGQAAALTGGYGSSYGTTAAQQAYANTMNGMNDKALELYNLAKDRYDPEGDEMRSNLSALGQMEDRNRSMYDSDRAEWHQRLNDLRAGQQTEYQRYADQLAQYNTDYNNAWNQYAYWEDLAEKKRQFDADLAYKRAALAFKNTK